MTSNDDLWAEIQGKFDEEDVILKICRANKIQVPDYYNVDCDQGVIFKKVIKEQYPEYFV